MSGHSHSGGGGHTHGAGAGAGDRRRLATELAITTTILAVEVVGAVVSGSLALLADAGHMLTDTAGLVIALIAAALAARPATDHRTWGYQRAEVLAATLQAAVLLAVGVFVLVEGTRRLFEPPTVSSGAMVVFGIVGLAGNLASMLVLTQHGCGQQQHVQHAGRGARGRQRRSGLGRRPGRRAGDRDDRLATR